MSDSSEIRRLDTWNEIATFLGVTVRTAMRWEHERGLPVHRVPGGEKQRVFAYAKDLTIWLDGAQTRGAISAAKDLTPPAVSVAPDPEVPALPDPVNADLTNSTAPEVEVPAPAVSVAPAAVTQKLSLRRIFSAAFVILALLLLGGWRLISYRAAEAMTLDDAEELTFDGLQKEGLVTDGTTLYFGVLKDGRIQLAAKPVAGGEMRMISTLAPNVKPQDISPDGLTLLVLRTDGHEHEREVWTVSLADGAAHRVGSLLCQSVAWRAPGQTIACALGREILLARASGEVLRSLVTFDAVPDELQWSHDGSQLRYLLCTTHTEQGTVWEARVSEAGVFSDAHRAASLQEPVWDFTNTARDGSYFLESGNEFGPRELWRIDRRGKLSGRLHWSAPGTKGLREIAFDPQGRRMFAVMARADSVEMYRVEGRQFFAPFHPGLNVRVVDFSPDGKRMAYVMADQGYGLWSSNLDGSNPVRLGPAEGGLDLPRWSPDGLRIAYMGKKPGRPWRIYIAPSGGGNIHEAASGSDSQGAPTWSPDGRRIAYANVECEELGTCAVRIIDLASGRVETVPGSSEFGTARWSPDGKYLAALHRSRHELFLYSFKTQQWTKLADALNGNDLAWSRDSRYLYANRERGSDPGVLRIPVNGAGTPEVVADLGPLAELPGAMGTFFAIDPDGAIIVFRWHPTTNIYAMDLLRPKSFWSW